MLSSDQRIQPRDRRHEKRVQYFEFQIHQVVNGIRGGEIHIVHWTEGFSSPGPRHALHGLAHTSQADGPVAKIGGRSFPGLEIGITTASIQATGTEPSAHIRLYTDSRTSLSAGGS